MEKLKDPAMLLSITNSIALVGSSAYFYKQLESIKMDMAKVSGVLTTVLKKMSDMDKGIQHKDEAFHALNDQIKRINDQVDELASLDMFENMDIDMAELTAILEESGIIFERPSLSQKPRRSGDRRNPTQSRRDVPEERRDIRSRGFSSRSRDSDQRPQRGSFTRTQPPSRPDTRPVQRDDPSRADTTVDCAEDDDLINEVRRQQSR